MGKVILDISISLDGFVAGLNNDSGNPMDDSIEKLHKWIMGDQTSGTPGDGAVGANRVLFQDLKRTTGAVIVGRGTYDLVDGWGGTHPFGKIPAFVFSRNIPVKIPVGETKFTFVTDGIESAVRQAKIAAGENNVYVVGGGYIAQQCLLAGLVDEMQLHISPVLLGAGISLFGHADLGKIVLEKKNVVDTPEATHIRYRIIR